MPTRATLRNRTNKALYRLTYNSYFDAIPLDTILAIVRDNIGEVVDEDGSSLSVILCGDNSRTRFHIAGFPAYLHLAWYKMQSGHYEVTAYVG